MIWGALRNTLALFLCGCLAASPSTSQLVEQLAGSEGLEAYSQLEQREDPASEQVLESALRHSNPRVRSHCLRLLAERRDTRWLPAFMRLLKDPDPSVYKQAARSLVQMMDTSELVQVMASPETPPAACEDLLALLLKDPAELASVPLQDWLMKEHPPSMELSLLRLLRDCWSPRLERKLRREVADLMPALQQAHRRLASYCHGYARDPHHSTECRQNALMAYASLAGPKSFEGLKALSSDPNLAPVFWIALGYGQADEAVPVLQRALEGGNLGLPEQIQAVRGLGKILGKPQPRRILLNLLKHPQPELRFYAWGGLGNIGDESCLKPMHDRLTGETDEACRRRGKRSLEQIQMRLKLAEPL